MLVERLLPCWTPRPELRPRARDDAEAALRLRWLGTAGWVVETGSTTLAIDPFVSRPTLLEAVGRPLVPDVEELRRRLPRRLDAILIGHSHYDHLLDAPLLAQLTGARLVGSRTTCAFGRAARLPAERLVELPPHGARLTVGDIDVRFVASLHGRLLFGRVPHPGHVLEPPRLPARWFEYRAGDVYGILLRANGVAVYHNGSADLLDDELRDERADVLLVGLAGRGATPRYVERLVGCLRPRVVVPMHYDAFFERLDRGVRLIPGIDLDGFLADARRCAPSATQITPDFGDVLVVPARDPRATGIATRVRSRG